MAKFKGGSDDWLDDEDSSGPRSATRAPKNKKPQPGWLKIEEANATVAEVFPNQCAVLGDDGRRYAATYRKAKLPYLAVPDRAPVAVGDRVRLEILTPQSGVIDGISVRRNELVRPAPARATRHVLTANVDRVIIVAACRDPEFTPGLVDRFLVAAQFQGIEPVIVVTKLDLQAPGAPEPWKIYADLGFRVLPVSVIQKRGLEELRSLIADGLTTFCGHSGVGKTSLLNSLLGHQVGKTGEVSMATGKGQHTTTGAYLVPGTRLVDTPGIREFGLMGIAPERLKEFFPEFKGMVCATEDCMHRNEEGCAAHALPRYVNYRRILESLIAGEN